MSNEDLREEQLEFKAEEENILQRIKETCFNLERRLKGNVILYMMAEGWSSIERQHVDDIDDFLHSLEKEEGKDLYLVLHSSGGDADAAYHIAKMLNEYVGDKSELNIIVPRWAKSAATLLALAGNRVFMTKIAELGPVDPQIKIGAEWVSAASIELSLRKILKTLLDLSESVKRLPEEVCSQLFSRMPINQIGEYDRLITYSKELAKEILIMRMYKGDEKAAESVADKLVTGYSYHGRPITCEDAKAINIQADYVPPGASSLVKDLYNHFKALIRLREQHLEPLITFLRQEMGLDVLPKITDKIVIETHGLLYVPSYKFLQRFTKR